VKDSLKVRIDTIRIVGPVFSGSMPSLRRTLDAQYRGKQVFVNVITGGATVGENAQVLRECVPGAVDWNPEEACEWPMIQFHATVHSIDASRRLMEKVLREDFDIGTTETAYLVESGTAYGEDHAAHLTTHLNRDDATRSDSLDPLVIPFPMNISRLRSEYSRQTTFDTLAFGRTESRTRLEWRDPASVSETPPPMSELTAPTIERTVADIERTLRLHPIRAIGIVATDIRDRLFVASLVKQRLRDVHLFFFSGHSLYVRPELNEDLRGSFVLSTYPLFLENQFWDLTHNYGRQRLAFTSDISEGTYNAVLAQLDTTDLMTDYTFPLEGIGHQPPPTYLPPVWLNVIGANSILPVTAEPAVVAKGAPDTSYILGRRDPFARKFAEPPTRPLEQILLILLLGVLIFFALDQNTRESWSILPKPRLVIRRMIQSARRRRTHVEKLPGPSFWDRTRVGLLLHSQTWGVFRIVALVCGVCPLLLYFYRPAMHGTAAQIFDSSTLNRMSAFAELSTSTLGLTAMALIMVVALGGVIATSYETLSAKAEARAVDWRGTSWSKYLGVLGIALLYLTLSAMWLFRIPRIPDPAHRAMLLMRVLDLGSGVTPTVPLIVGATVLVVWSTAHLRRVRRLGELTAFEAACAEGGIDATKFARASYTRNIEDLPFLPAENNTFAEQALGSAEAFRQCVFAIRSTLLDLLPKRQLGQTRRDAYVLLGCLTLSWLLVMLQLNRSIETAAIQPLFKVRWLPSVFDLLFRMLMIATISLSVWTLYRFALAWSWLRVLLRNVDALPIGQAFNRLPNSIALLPRFTPFSAPTDAAVNLTIDRAARARWFMLKDIAAFAKVRGQERDMRSEDDEFDLSIKEPVIAIHELLCDAGEQVRLEGKPAKQGPGLALGIAQELLALYVVDYIEWIVRHLRELAAHLVIVLALTTIFLASYPFEPASVVKVSFFVFMAASVLTIAAVLFQMNRNSTLSRMTQTTPGEVNWDIRLVLNLLLIAGVPLISVLSTQFPEVRSFLFSWISPMLKAFGKA
jgi:hypothetical protein